MNVNNDDSLNNDKNTKQVICKNCGAVPGEGALFCTVCGTMIERTPAYSEAVDDSPVEDSDSAQQAEEQDFAESLSSDDSLNNDKNTEQIICKNCGAVPGEGAMFCTVCGTVIERTPADSEAIGNSPVAASGFTQQAEEQDFAEPLSSDDSLNNDKNTEQIICKNCGAVPGEGAMFCTVCGTVIERTPADSEAIGNSPVAVSDFAQQAEKQDFAEPAENVYRQPEPYAGDAGYQSFTETAQPVQYRLKTQPKKKKSKIKLIIILSASLLLIAIAAAIVIPMVIENAKQSKYDDAILLMESGNYAEAQTIFTELEDFEDSADKVTFCKNSITYEEALSALEKEDYENAKTKFLSLGSFKDSSEKAEYCADFISYGEAEDLFNSGDYTAAKEIYQQLPEDLFPDTMEKYDLCINKEDYIAAEALYNEGKYYDAYLAFGELGDFEDAADRQLQCVQPFPGTTVTYQNEDYTTYELSLDIIPPDDGTRNYLKIYTDTEVLVCSVAIEQGETASILLPSGNYMIKRAFGFGDWFGETDMFGDEGTYFVLINSNEDSQYFYLEYDGIYTLTLGATDDIPGAPVDEEYEDRTTF